MDYLQIQADKIMYMNDERRLFQQPWRKGIMPFKWRFAGGPMMAHLKWYLDPLSTPSTEKSCQSWSRLTPFLDARMEEVPATYLEDGLYAI